MPAERYFINTSLQCNSEIILKETELHHLVRVMRTRVGEEVELVNGQGCLSQAIVKEIHKDKALLQIISCKQEVIRPIQVVLVQAIPKPNRLDFILEKGTELGVDEFWLFPAQHSLKKDFSPSQEERLQSLIIGAMKQCGRLFLPKIIMQPTLDKWPKFSQPAFFGATTKEAPVFLNAWTSLSSIIFCIGPESGFTDKEIQILQDRGAQGVKLHQNILRTETAGLMALSLIEHRLLQSKYLL
jgi:16S rRNA (uracil1498-N3)-methyltransferase